MGVRREGREAAVQFLYQRDLDPEADRGSYYAMRGISPSARRFCDELLDGFVAVSERVDGLIRETAKNYEFARISAVDRNILRIAASELVANNGTPPAVAINEAIEIAKKYSTAESGRFVNGVLDRIRQTLAKPAPPGAPAAKPDSAG